MDGDVVLLSTNGLTDVVDDDQIANVLRAGKDQPLEPQAQRLVDLALERGGPDNITAVLARYKIP